MPLKNQYGFFFTEASQNRTELGITRTIAHELSHGCFRLRHTFSPNNLYIANQGTTSNLMDYVTPTTEKPATHLRKYQWDLVHDPETMVGVFEDDGEGAYEEGECEAVIASLQKTYKEGDEILWQSYSENKVQLITPDIYIGSRDEVEWHQYLAQFFDLFRYTCSGNETFASIASDFGTSSVEQIRRFNQDKTIGSGTSIVIPPNEAELQLLLTPSYVNCYAILHEQRALHSNLLYVLEERLRINHNLLELEQIKKIYGQAVLTDFTISMVPVAGQVKSIIELKIGKNLAHYVVLEKMNGIPVADFNNLDRFQSLIDVVFGGVTVVGKYSDLINSGGTVYSIVEVSGDVNGLIDFARTTNGLEEE